MRRIEKRGACWLAAAVVFASACGGQTRSPDQPIETRHPDAGAQHPDANAKHPDVKVSDYATVAAQILCDNVALCCQGKDQSLDAAGCKVYADSFFGSYSVSDPSVGDHLVSGRCLDALARATSICQDIPPCPEFIGAATPHGKLGGDCGGTCSSSYDDIGCNGEGFDGLDRPPLPECFTEDGLYCNLTPPEAQCSPLRQVGESCSVNEACDGSWCKNGICAAYLSEGSDCNGFPDACGNEAYCGNGSSFCYDRTPVPGATCMCRPLRSDGGKCVDRLDCAHSPCVDGKCAPTPLDPTLISAACKQ